MLRASSTRQKPGARSLARLASFQDRASGIMVDAWKKPSTLTPRLQEYGRHDGVAGQPTGRAGDAFRHHSARWFVMTYNDVFFAMGALPWSRCRWYCSSSSPEELIPFDALELYARP